MHKFFSQHFWWMVGAIAYLVVLFSGVFRTISFVRTEDALRGTPIERANLVPQLQRQDLEALVSQFAGGSPPPSGPVLPSSPLP